MSTVKATSDSIYFRLRGHEFNLDWEQFSSYLGFINCTTNVDYATRNFNKLEFWHEITGENIVGASKPRTSHICNPTLRFLHKWIGITLFPRDDIRTVREINSRILYAMVHKIRISPVKAMVQHWISAPSRIGSFDFTSIITKFCTYVNILDGFNQYITTPRIVLKKDYFIQALIIAGGPNDTIEFQFCNSHARLTLPCSELKLYRD